jgi:glucokinase
MTSSKSSNQPEFAIGCDIGGTQMRAALVNRAGEVLDRSACLTLPENGLADATERLLGLIDSAIGDHGKKKIAGIGISAAGPINPNTGAYSHPPNLPGWHEQSMLPRLQDASGLDVTIGHDAHVAAIAESNWGAAQGAGDVVYVTVSTGIGGGMLSEGRPVNGQGGMAGEIGHLLIDATGFDCNAGCRGCLEVLASGGGVAAQARARIAAGDDTVITDLAGNDPALVTGRIVYEAAEKGDLIAKEIVEIAIDALASGFANLLATFDPAVLVVGGSVVVGDASVAGLSAHWDDVLSRTKARSLLRYRNEVPVVVSNLGDDVGPLGAAAMAFNRAG